MAACVTFAKGLLGFADSAGRGNRFYYQKDG